MPTIWRGSTPPKNPPRSILWRAGYKQYRVPLLGECPKNPSALVYQLALLWEVAFCFSEFFLKTQRICPFHNEWFTSAPAHTALSVQQFLSKNGMTPTPNLPIHLISPWVTFFVSLDGKSPQRETFCQCRRGGKTKQNKTNPNNGRNIKRHQNW